MEQRLVERARILILLLAAEGRSTRLIAAGARLHHWHGQQVAGAVLPPRAGWVGWARSGH